MVAAKAHRRLDPNDPYFLLSDEELEVTMKDLMLQIGSGATNISSPDAGQVGYVGRTEALKTLTSLRRSYARRHGFKFDEERIGFTKVILAKDYHQR